MEGDDYAQVIPTRIQLLFQAKKAELLSKNC